MTYTFTDMVWVFTLSATVSAVVFFGGCALFALRGGRKNEARDPETQQAIDDELRKLRKDESCGS